ncbi:Uncharacterised protein [Mycobacteroides abscessus subsp. abscessus]|nr:Uncharacterised protein [Mycobacteroides abscessus subsp. abscessus]
MTAAPLRWYAIGRYDVSNLDPAELHAGAEQHGYTVFDENPEAGTALIGGDHDFLSTGKNMLEIFADARRALPRITGAHLLDLVNVTRACDMHVFDVPAPA